MLSVNLGPLALSLQHLNLLAAVALGMAVAWWLERHQKGERKAESVLFWLFILALLVARLSFVASYWPQYRSDLLQMVDLRDGGFMAWPGVVTAMAGVALVGWRRQALRRPLGAGLATGLLMWSVANVTLDHYQDRSLLPPVTLQNASGAAVALQDAQGRPMVVNLWATWCPPCRREMPVLRQAIADYPHISFKLVNQGESVADVSTFLGTVGIGVHLVLFDPRSELAALVGSAALPTTLFYSADGRLLGSHLGELSAASLAHALEAFNTP